MADVDGSSSDSELRQESSGDSTAAEDEAGAGPSEAGQPGSEPPGGAGQQGADEEGAGQPGAPVDEAGQPARRGVRSSDWASLSTAEYIEDPAKRQRKVKRLLKAAERKLQLAERCGGVPFMLFALLPASRPVESGVLAAYSAELGQYASEVALPGFRKAWSELQMRPPAAALTSFSQLSVPVKLKQAIAAAAMAVHLHHVGVTYKKQAGVWPASFPGPLRADLETAGMAAFGTPTLIGAALRTPDGRLGQLDAVLDALFKHPPSGQLSYGTLLAELLARQQ